MNWFNRFQLFFIVSITIVFYQTTSLAIPLEKIKNTARKVTVKIRTPGSPGTGVIIGKTNNSYYVLTAQHVVNVIAPKEKGSITTNDNNQYFFTGKSVNDLPNQIDLAVIKFESEKDYPIATLSNYQYDIDKNRNYGINNNKGKNNSNSLKQEKRYIFVSGYPITKSDVGHIFNPGILYDDTGSAVSNPQVTNPETSFTGYQMLYTNLTHPGMSGGPILNTNGHLIGIHGRADGKKIGKNNEIIQQYLNEFGSPVRVKFGLSLGIPTNTFLDWYNQNSYNWGLKINNNSPDKMSLANLNQWQPKLPTQNKNNVFYWLSLANQKWRLNQIQEATRAFDRAIEIENDFALAWFAKGFALGFNQKYEKALKACRKADDKLDSNSILRYEILRCQASALQELEQFKQALTMLNRAMKIEPDDYTAYAIQGELKFALGQLDGALESFNKAIKLRKKQGLLPSAILLTKKSFTLMNLEKYNDALKIVKKAITINQKYAPAWSKKGFILRKLGRYSESLKAYNRATELASNDPNIWNNKGVTLFQMEQYDKAIKAFNKALDINPDYKAARENRRILKNQIN